MDQYFNKRDCRCDRGDFIIINFCKNRFDNGKVLFMLFNIVNQGRRINHDFAKGNCLIPNNDKYTRYKKEINGNWILKKAISNKCYKMWHSCVITWNGDLVPCCFDKNANFKFGNIIEKPINRIWKSNEYKNYRTTILKNRRSISICRNCSE